MRSLEAGLRRRHAHTGDQAAKDPCCRVVGIGGKDDAVSFSALELFHFARTLRGCVAGSLDAERDLPQFFDWVRRGQLRLDQLVTGSGELVDVQHALDDLAAGRGVQTLLAPNG